MRGRRLRLEEITSSFVLLLVISACSSLQSAPSAEPTTKPTPAAVYSPTLEDWKKCGSSVAPPADVLKVPTPPPVSLGAAVTISVAEAKRDVAGAIREASFELWAETHNEPVLLSSGCLGPAKAKDLNWKGEIDVIQHAMSSPGGGHLEFSGTSHPISARVVSIPDSVKTFLLGNTGEAGELAIVVTVMGSGLFTEVTGNGDKTTLNSSSEDSVQSAVVFGRYIDGPPLGPVWYQIGYAPCGLTAGTQMVPPIRPAWTEGVCNE